MPDHKHKNEKPLSPEERALAYDRTESLIEGIQKLINLLPPRIRNTVAMDLGHSITCSAILQSQCPGCATQSNVTGLAQHGINHGFIASPPHPATMTLEVDVVPAAVARGSTH